MISPILTVKDVDAAVKFYTENLNFKHDFSMAGPDGSNVFAFVSLGDNAIGISKEDLDVKCGVGVVFMVYVPDDIDAYYQAVQDNGTAIAAPIKDEYWGDRIFSVVDMDGYYLTFAKTVKQADMQEIADIMRVSGTS